MYGLQAPKMLTGKFLSKSYPIDGSQSILIFLADYAGTQLKKCISWISVLGVLVSIIFYNRESLTAISILELIVYKRFHLFI